MIVQALVLALCLAPAATPLVAQGDKKGGTPDKEPVDLKVQRDLANAFMRKATEQALKNLDTAKDEKADKDAKAARAALEKQLAGKRFFGGGTSKEELAAFQGGLKEADAAGVKVGGEALNELIKAAVFQRLSDKDIKAIATEVAKQNDATPDGVLRAVAAEFRARIAADLKTKKK